MIDKIKKFILYIKKKIIVDYTDINNPPPGLCWFWAPWKKRWIKDEDCGL